MAEIKLERFNYPEDLTQQRKLFVECFPETLGTPIVTEEHYKWKFKSFPSKAKATSYEYVARLDGEIIGYYAALPYEYTIQNKLYSVGMVCDVMTGVKARGKGVFTKLGIYSTDQFKEEGLAFSTGYPIRPEVIPGHKKAGWEFPFKIPMYGKFIKMDSFLKTRKKSFLIPFANIILHLYNGNVNLFNKKIKTTSIFKEYYSSDQINEIQDLDDFFSEWTTENPIALNKNKQFLKWRLGAPEKKYHIVIARNKEDNKIIGYTIFREVEKEGVPCIGVLDFCTLSRYKKFAFILLKEIEKMAKTKNAELILLMMMRRKAKEYKISSNGFLKTPFPFSFIIKQFDQTIDSDLLKNEKNWNLMWIDSDDL